MDFTLIARAGLTQTEFGERVGVSRVTVNTWVNGHMKPHKFIKDRVAAALEELKQQLDEQAAGDKPA